MTILNDLIIKKGAIFVADAHFKRGDSSLIAYFSHIPKGVQIFLMGDIFHLLVGSVKSSVNENFELLNLLYKMSFTNEIIYVEGNHDFGLKSAFAAFKRLLDSMESSHQDCKKDSKDFANFIESKSQDSKKDSINFSESKNQDSINKNSKFPNFKDSKNIESNSQKVSNIRIFSYKKQPIILRDYQNNICILAHGDKWISPMYDFYRLFLDSKPLLFCYKVLDSITFGKFYRRFSHRISKRKVKEFSYFRNDFTNFMQDRIRKYRTFIIDKILKTQIDSKRNEDSKENINFCIIEGHFHLGQNLNQTFMLDSKKDSKKTITIHYNSLSSQYFHKKYFTLQNGKIHAK